MSDTVHDAKRLAELQALPLERKIMITQARIIEFHNHFNGNVCISFSGGKDSTVLLDIARRLYPDIPAVFSNTGLEYPEIQSFVKRFNNVEIVRPTMRFDEVISTYGYPLISKEVSEAIYYARRIRSQNVQVEREREREREAQREAEADRVIPLCGEAADTHTHTQRRKRTELCGRRAAGDAICSNNVSPNRVEALRNLGGGDLLTCPDELRERPQDNPSRTDARSRGSKQWRDWRRGCL